MLAQLQYCGCLTSTHSHKFLLPCLEVIDIERMVDWRLLLVAVCSLLVICSTGVLAAEGLGAIDDEDLEPNETVLQIDLQSDGSAEWRIEHRYRLADDDQEQAFDSLATDIEENESAYLDRFVDRMTSTVESSAEATGREMAVQNASVTAEKRTLPQDYGIVTYRFEWTNFAAVDGEQLTAGDALTGLFLDDETRLLVTWSDEYSLAQADPEPDSSRTGAVQWRGPIDFGPDEPRVVVTSESSADTVAGTDGTVDDTDPTWVGYTVPAGIVILTLLLVVVGGRWWFKTAQTDGHDRTGESVLADSNAESDPADSDLLSNEEQVLRLLADHGGRIKQQEVVQTLGWTDAKTSQVVRDLREEGKVESFRLGRENVLKLAYENDESNI